MQETTATTEFTTMDAANQLDMRLDYLYMLLRCGKIAGRKHDGRWLIPASAISARLKTRKERDNG